MFFTGKFIGVSAVSRRGSECEILLAEFGKSFLRRGGKKLMLLRKKNR
jgi:hypothetical protein